LIDDILAFAGVGRTRETVPVALNPIVRRAWGEQLSVNGRAATLDVQELPTVKGDASLLGQLWGINTSGSDIVRYTASSGATTTEGKLTQAGINGGTEATDARHPSLAPLRLWFAGEATRADLDPPRR